MYTRILVPLDGSRLAEAALPGSWSLAQCLGTEIRFVRMAVSPVVVSDGPQVEIEAKNSIESNCSKLEAAGIRASFLIHERPPADTTLAVSDAMRTDIIAIPTSSD